jgi:hypothetical protein
MKLRFLILAAEILLFCGWMQSQETVPLRVVERHNSLTIQEAIPPLFNFVQCDAAGNIYFLICPSPCPAVMTVLRRLSPRSLKESSFALAPAFKGAAISHLVVQPDGTVFELINAATEPYSRIVKLDQAGKVVSAIGLKNSECMFGEMNAYHFGVFASGKFLVLGIALPHPPASANGPAGGFPLCASVRSPRQHATLHCRFRS